MTPDQLITLQAVGVLTVRKHKAGQDIACTVTVKDICSLTNRIGQPQGLLCGNLVSKGYLNRVAPATYQLTTAGRHALLAAAANPSAAS